MSQKGFTLLEILVTVAISGVILVGVVLSINQITTGSVRSSNDVNVLTNLSQASLVLKNDLIMTQDTDFAATPQSTATLDWVDYSTFQSEEYQSHSSSYALSGTNLMRNYDGVTTIAGRNITAVSFSRVDRVITVSLTATSSAGAGKSETLTFTAYMRSLGITQ